MFEGRADQFRAVGCSPPMDLQVTGRDVLASGSGERWYETRRIEGLTWAVLGVRAGLAGSSVRDSAMRWATRRGLPWPVPNRLGKRVAVARAEMAVALDDLSADQLWEVLLTSEFRSVLVEDTERFLRERGLGLDAEDMVQSALAEIIRSGIKPDPRLKGGTDQTPHRILRGWVRRKVYSYLRDGGARPLLRAWGLRVPSDPGVCAEQVVMPETGDDSLECAGDVYRVCCAALRAAKDTPQGRKTQESHGRWVEGKWVLGPARQTCAQERLPRVLGLMLEGWSVAEMGKKEGVSRNRMASIVTEVREILRDRSVWIGSQLE